MTLDATRVQAFYSFMIERESIRQRRLAGLPREQWTSDPIFQEYSFTNVDRADDRMSCVFRKIYETIDNLDDTQNLQDLLMSAAVFRYFGTEQSASVLGLYHWARPDGRYGDEYFKELLNYGLQGDLSFTSAYIIPACGDTRDKYEVVHDILKGILAVRAEVVEDLEGYKSWKEACHTLCRCWGCGSFMAKEILLDYLMMAGTDRLGDWETYTPVGPGARRGAGRIRYGYLNPLSEDDALEVIREVYSVRAEFWPKEFKPLSLTAIQFQFCEIDKYSRVAEGRRPKRKFRPTIDEITRNS